MGAAVPRHLGEFVAARLVGGLAIGVASVLAPLYIAEISPRPVLLIHGEKAHSRYFSETAYAAAAEPKELLIIPGANHTDLYDRVDKIPFDRISEFFGQSLK